MWGGAGVEIVDSRIFWVGQFGKQFFGWLDLSVDFRGIQNYLKLLFCLVLLLKQKMLIYVLGCLECCYEELSKQTQTFNF